MLVGFSHFFVHCILVANQTELRYQQNGKRASA
jgi:hypothetical protein